MKALKMILGLALTLSLFSCGNVTEEITIKEDGSGTYHVEYDMIPMMKQMSFQMIKAFSALDTTKPAKSDEEIMAKVEEMIWAKFPEKIDSIIDYKEILPDSILNDKKKMAVIENANGFLRGGKEEGVLMSGMDYRFSNISELEAFFELMEKNNPEARKTQGLNLSGKTSAYTFKKRLISRTSKKSKSKGDEEEKTPEEKAKEEKMMEEMFGEGTFRTVINLPKEVESVKGTNVISQEGKKVVLEYSMMDIMNDKVSTDFEIIMKK
ncbi:hypothetical protein KFE98_05375 [bacterium SCSIO 12741]|nr:hypothetical protein KFE98_05375 [bacterium SCSIO 12741]